MGHGKDGALEDMYGGQIAFQSLAGLDHPISYLFPFGCEMNRYWGSVPKTEDVVWVGTENEFVLSERVDEKLNQMVAQFENGMNAQNASRKKQQQR